MKSLTELLTEELRHKLWEALDDSYIPCEEEDAIEFLRMEIASKLSNLLSKSDFVAAAEKHRIS